MSSESTGLLDNAKGPLPRIRQPVERFEGSRIHIPTAGARLSAADRKEIRFWSSDPRYNRSSGLWDHLALKLGEIRSFESLLPMLEVRPGMQVLELGAGQGWASVMLKRHSPASFVHALELSPEALLGTPRWEELLGVSLDGLWAFPASETPFESGQFDRVFTFAAFHHFAIGGRQISALAEALRLVAPGGRLVLLCEPTSPSWLRRWHRAKLNRIRAAEQIDVEEDVLVFSELAAFARASGVQARVLFDTRLGQGDLSPAGFLRTAVVRAIPMLGHFAPIGAHFVFDRPR